MNFFEQELRRFTGKTTAFKSCKPLYAGRACFILLSGNRRARLELVTSGVADHYDALQVTILSTTDGKIDCLRFRFSDFFAPRKAGCSGICCPHIWVDCGRAEWYVAPTAAEVAPAACTAGKILLTKQSAGGPPFGGPPAPECGMKPPAGFPAGAHFLDLKYQIYRIKSTPT